MMFASLNSNRVVSNGTGTTSTSEVHEFSPSFLVGFVFARSLAFSVVLSRSMFVLLYFFFWPLYCLFFFELQFLITPFVSLDLSWTFVCFFLAESKNCSILNRIWTRIFDAAS